jgi:hypothetical protein
LDHQEDPDDLRRLALAAPGSRPRHRQGNVGDTNHNYRVRQIAEIVADVFPGCELSFGDGSDNRSYRVSFEKINTQLPGFACEWNAERGARQLRSVFEAIDMSDEVFKAAPFTRLKRLEELLATKQLDQDFYWAVPPLTA